MPMMLSLCSDHAHFAFLWLDHGNDALFFKKIMPMSPCFSYDAHHAWLFKIMPMFFFSDFAHDAFFVVQIIPMMLKIFSDHAHDASCLSDHAHDAKFLFSDHAHDA